MRAILALSLFLPGLAFGQPSGELQEESLYAAVFFQPGVPDFAPLRRQISREGFTATIPRLGSAHAVRFIWGKNDDGESVYWVMHRRQDDTVSLARPAMEPDRHQTLQASLDLRLDPDSEAATPLQLRLLPLHHALLYRWPGSAAAVIGGVPTAKPSALSVGAAAPDFTVQKLDGGSVSLRSVEGKVVVINSWATYCAPCVAEMPGLNNLVQKYSSAEVVFLAIAWNTEKDLRAFLEQREFRYQQTLANPQTTTIFGEAFPRHVIVDVRGNIVFDRIGGAVDIYRELDEEIAALIRGR